MCLATAPQVLLLDEPLAGMGAEETAAMLELLASLREGHAILLVEHDMDAVFRIADRITVMVNGAVIATRRARRRARQRRRAGGLPRRVGMSSEGVRASTDRASRRSSATLLRVRDLHAHYGASHVLRGVELEVAAGEALGLLGRNGMGKTTLMRTILGIVHASAGAVAVRGRDVTGAASERHCAPRHRLRPGGTRHLSRT